MIYRKLLCWTLFACAFPACIAHGRELVQISNDFSTDPGWEGYNNRVEGTDLPTIRQDFGWSPTSHASQIPGEIGGRIFNSRAQAYYAMPFGQPLSLDDKLSASGTLAITGLQVRGVAYLGFFNDAVHEWRPWNSLMFRLWEEDGQAQVMVDHSTADWQAAGFESDILIPPDGSVHSWRLEYDPDATIDPEWKYPELKPYITDQTGNGRPYELQGEEFILERARKDHPELTREKLRTMLEELRDQGVVVYFHRHGKHRWWIRPNPADAHGRIKFQFDNDNVYNIYVEKTKRAAPTSFNRFGIVNVQRYGNSIELWLGDLTVNGEKVDLSHDPHWLGRNNRITYATDDFHARQDFGWAQTNWAGAAPGEIGGTLWRMEVDDPLFAYYADEVGKLTLEDPIEFSGRINFTHGMTDAAMFFGYFNREAFMREFQRGAPPYNFPRLGIANSDLTRVGWYFAGDAVTRDGDSTSEKLNIFHPDRQPHDFSFKYDPAAGEHGRVTLSLDQKQATFNLSAEQRKGGVSLDRFGLATLRSGGNSVTVYFDDLTYTARRDPNTQPKRHRQEIKQVPYPSSGRKY